MPVYKDVKRSSWYVKCQVKDPVTNAPKQIMKRGFKTKTEAKNWEAEQRTSGSNSTGITFHQVMDRYFAYNAPKERTEEQQRRMVERYFPLIDQPVNAITKPMLMEWYLRTSSLDLKPGTINLLLAVVKSVFKYGADFYELPNPATGLKRVKNTQRKYETWTPDEFRQFLEAVDNDMYRSVFMFIYWTGCRRGEALGLRKQDYDPASGTIYIHHAVKDYKREGFKELKNSSSIRRIKLDTTTNRMIADLCNSLPDGDSWLFGINEPVSVNTLQKRFVKDIRESGVKQIRLHDLRHSFATNAVNHGVNIVALSKYLGHSTIEQTLATYSHLLEKTADEMNKIMSTMHANA